MSYCLFFFFEGLISLVAQTIFLREITTLFYGNEFFYGLGLGLWLLFTGLGSLVAKKLTKSQFINVSSLFIIQFVLIVFFPILVVFLHWLVLKHVPFGQLPKFWFSFPAICSILFIFCFPLGLQFGLAVSFLLKKYKYNAVNYGYLWETIGAITGGLIFSFLLSTTAFPLTKKLNYTTWRWRYPQLVQVKNSRYGQIAISNQNQQKNFFRDGQFAFTNEEAFANQQLLNLILPFSRQTEQILLIGNPSITSEIKKQQPKAQIDFLDIDEQFLALVKDFLPYKINFINADPRKFFNQSFKKYNLIIINTGNPQTLLNNRYFTKESFAQLKSNLQTDGLIILLLYAPIDYQSQEVLGFLSSLHQALKSVFPYHELLILEDQLIFIGSPTKLTADSDKLTMSEQQFFKLQVNNINRQQILNKITTTNAQINSDFSPTAVFYQQLFWQTMFNFQTPNLLLKIIKILPLLFLLIILVMLKPSKDKQKLRLSIFFSSLILMSLEILIIFMFQTKIGYLYTQISLIFAGVLTGLALGVKITPLIKNKVQFLHLNYLGYLFLIFIFYLSLDKVIANFSVYWLVLALMFGLIHGQIFSLISFLCSAKNALSIYVYDLFGGSLGALLTAGFLLPYYGLPKLLFGLSCLVFINLLISAKLQELT